VLIKTKKRMNPSNQAVESSSPFRWLLSFVSPHKRGVISLLALSLLGSGLALTQPYLTKLVIDDGLIAKNFDILLTFSLLLFSLGVFSTLLSGLSRYWHTRLSGNILFDLRESVYAHLQRLSPSFYARHRTGDILSRLDGDVAEIQRFALDGLFSVISAVIGLIGALAFLFYLHAHLALIALVMLPLEWLWLRMMRPRVERHTRGVRECAADISSFLVETLPAIKFIQTVAAEKRESLRLARLNQRYLDNLLGLQVVEFATRAVPSTLTTFSRTLVFIIGGYWVIQDQMALGSLIAFSAYLGMAVGPIHTLLGLYVAIRRVRVSLDRVSYLTQTQADIAHDENQGVMPLNIRGEISFNDIHFGYPCTDKMVFKQANVILPAGEKIGIYGPSGVGKTTLVDLLLRHFEPSQGHIFIDGRNLSEYNLFEWRRQVAVVAQDIVLFRGTLEENIRYANPEASDQAVLHVVEQAQLSELVSELPEGLNTMIGERGASLSGGQRQRIALARALLQNPSILILDEATSAVDQAQEIKLMQVIDTLFASKTRLVISHRENPINNADCWLTIVDGQFQLSRIVP
jgi:ATP-binding cassette subfamily B protein